MSRIDAWYQRLENRWALDNLPEVLLRTGPLGLLYWQWLALPALILIAWLGGLLLSRADPAHPVPASRRAPPRAGTTRCWRGAARPADPGLGGRAGVLPGAAAGAVPARREFVDQLLRAAFLIVCFWSLVRAIDVVRQFIGGSPWAVHHPASRSLLPLGAGGQGGHPGLRGGCAPVGVRLPGGQPVAGLGIGGLAVALAAQKSFENLFGAFSIGGDQPFREGDFVKVEDFVGTVEAIGLRSTRIRTPDRTLITIPNGKLAEMQLESFTVRDRMRLHTRSGWSTRPPSSRRARCSTASSGCCASTPRSGPTRSPCAWSSLASRPSTSR